MTESDALRAAGPHKSPCGVAVMAALRILFRVLPGTIFAQWTSGSISEATMAPATKVFNREGHQTGIEGNSADLETGTDS